MINSEPTTLPVPNPAYARLALGTAPDSWGIWFPDDPQQPHWSTFLDEVVQAGFRTIELGPFGYLPTNPEQLNREVISRHPDRISYIHLKQVNPAVGAQRRSERVGFYEAVQRGAMVEPPGAPAMKPLLDDLAALDRDLGLIIEQDMYPAPKDSAVAIATRTRDYFAGIGLLPAAS